jgi:hypothetical protein
MQLGPMKIQIGRENVGVISSKASPRGVDPTTRIEGYGVSFYTCSVGRNFVASPTRSKFSKGWIESIDFRHERWDECNIPLRG